ncbi:MAG: hypothetical protein JWR52_3205 [Marmoricola sp.]|nr:hypothetical protein [Marmoricola sp.]
MTEHAWDDALLAGWWEHHRLVGGTREERLALEHGEPADVQTAYDTIEALVDSGQDEAVDVLAALIDVGPDGAAAIVGAGPLEDLLHGYGDALVDGIEERARQSRSFAKALASVWLEHGSVSPETEQRLARWVR